MWMFDVTDNVRRIFDKNFRSILVLQDDSLIRNFYQNY